MNNEDLLNAIYSSITDYVVMTLDIDGKVTSWNAGAEKIHGFTHDEIIGKSSEILFTEQDREKGMPRKELEKARTEGKSLDYRWHLRKDKSRFWGDGLVTPIHDPDLNHIGYLKILKDITTQKKMEDELVRLANYDVLTGLGSRAAFNSVLAEMSAVCTRSGQMLNVLLLDMDNFKQVNDKFGHPGGDQLLKQVAARIKGITREADYVARLGGDEFVILQLNVTSPAAAGNLSEKLIKELGKPFELNGHPVNIGVSIGIAVCPNDANHSSQLMMKADLALYMAKENGRNCFRYFTPNLQAESQQRELYSRELRNAVQHGQFWLSYQPKVDCKSGETVGLEALLRCYSPVLARLAVDDVITLARDLGLSKKITEWVVQEACWQLRAWQSSGLGILKISINVCPPEMNDEAWLQRLYSIIIQSGVSADDIELEVTERLVLDLQNGGLSGVIALRDKGISIALDDFGIGYSSLSYLTKLPIDTLKLDQSFLRDVPSNPQSCAIANSVIGLALQLGLEVVAEGVESQEQIDFLSEINCSSMQGFLISKPLSAAEMTTWLLH